MKTQRREVIGSQQRGYSLAEVLVAMAVLTIVIVAALMIYDRSNRVFNQSVQASDMQQSTRVAFEKLVAEVRLAGFDFDRDGVPFGSLAPTWVKNTVYQAGNLVQPTSSNGHTYLCSISGTTAATEPVWPLGAGQTVTDGTAKWQENGSVQYQQPDEQIEYAGPAAITIRGNFNYETALGPCPTSGACKECENGREQCLESTQFPLVTTENDEIVTYALVSSNASKNTDTIVFYADLSTPRKSNPVGKEKENKCTISGVDLSGNNPPYTLYRFAMKNNSTTGTAYDPVAIADNIRRMTFHYYTDQAGAPAKEVGCTSCTPAMPAMPFGGGQYDPADPYKTITERDTRTLIKSIRIELVGMNPVADYAYSDTDTAAPHSRKYELDTLVVPRNLGRHGMKEFATAPPGKPHVATVCAGACNAVYLTWEPPSGGGDVDSYSIVYDPGNCPGGGNPVDSVSYTTADNAGANLSGYAYSKITPGQTYRFAVQSVNKYGATLSDNCVQINVLNTTKPSPPASLDVSGGSSGTYTAVANGIQLYWGPVATNATPSTTCNDGSSRDETSLPFGENIAYVVYRSTDPSFKSTDAGVTTLTPTGAPAAGGLLTWTDTGVGNCLNYYYRIRAFASPCGLAGNDAMNQGGSVSLARSAVFPDDSAAPIQGTAKTTQTPAVPTGLGLFNQSCSGVVCDVTFNWNAVTQDTAGQPIKIDSYRATLYLFDAATSTWNVSATKTVSGTLSGTLTRTTFTGLDNTLLYRVTVMATQSSPCVNGAESAPVYWPCAWTGGTITVNPAISFGGTGAQGNPWIIQYPSSLIVTTQNPVQSVTAAVFNNATQAAIGLPITVNGPNTVFNIGLPLTPDGVECKVRISVTAVGGGCTINGNQFVIDEPPPGCALKDKNTDNSVVLFNTGVRNNIVDITLKNTSSDTLKLLKVIVRMNLSSGNKLSSVDITGGPSFSFGGSGCSGTSAMADFTSLSPPNIAAGQTNYGMTLTFTKATTSSAITSICIEYQVPFGDKLLCTIFPNAGTCTEPAGTCQ